jgi:DNA-binding IclR family transcriptional regulator
LEKGIQILDLVAQSNRELSTTEIYTTLGIPKATAFMILNVLERHALLKKTANGRYVIGVKLYKLGLAYISELDIVKVARPHLEALMRQTRFTTHLGTLDDGRVLFIDKVEPNTFVRFSTFPGMRSDIHMSSLGKAIAAHLPEDDLARIIAQVGLGAYTPKTITQLDRFMQELEKVRSDGYAIDDEEGELNVRCIGAPIFDGSGKMVAAVSITALVSQLPETAFRETGQRVYETAARISRELGYAGERQRETVAAGVDEVGVSKA